MQFKSFISPQKTIRYFYLIRLSPFLVFFFILTSIGCQPHKAGPKRDRLPSAEAELFRSKCSKCHDPELALKENRSESVWRNTIARMKEEHNAAISLDEIEILVKYHVERQNLQAALGKSFPNTKRSRAEWILFIASLQGLELNKDIQHTINRQIDHHIAKQ